MTLDPVFESVHSFTQEQFAAIVARRRDDLERLELLNGRIVMTPPAGWPQGGSGPLLIGLLLEAVHRPGLGRVIAGEQGFDLPSGDTVAPDAAVVLTATWERAEPAGPGRFLRIVPNVVVEILSPSTASRDRGEKKAIYERNGVDEYWIVDLLARRLLRFTLREGRYDLPDEAHEGESLDSTVVPGLALGIDELLPAP